MKLLNKLMERKARKKIDYYQRHVGNPIDYSPSAIFSKWKLHKIKKMALKLNSYYGRQFHIMPVANSDQIVIVDNVYIKNYNSKVSKSKRIDYNELLKMSWFSTPTLRIIK